MAKPIRNIMELRARFNRAKQKYNVRNRMVNLCDEIYLLKMERNSGFLPPKVTSWRDRVAPEYWESSNKGQNVVDVMTAVLSGHPVNWKCTIPGNVSSTVPSRAEMFLAGAFRLNGLRQQRNLLNRLVFQVVKHGAAAVRVTWMSEPPNVPVTIMPDPEGTEESSKNVVVHLHNEDSFPICIDVMDIRTVYPGARGAWGRPFSEIFYCLRRTVEDVMNEWEGRGNTQPIDEKTPRTERDAHEGEYVEWWGQDNDGSVWYAIAFDDHFIIKPTKTNYTALPWVIAFYKEGDASTPSFEFLPFLYPIFYALDKMDWVRSRSSRMVDMFAGMNPYHSGARPVQGVDATWGKIIELDEREDIRFPAWPGQPPDVQKEIQMIDEAISEGSFSAAMFGKLSSRVSGYALSQVIGADTLRTDTPRQNLELALTGVASLIFRLMQNNSVVHLGVTSQLNNRKMTAILSGDETRQLVTEAYVKPKQTSDEIRLATLGAQIAAQPNPPVSLRYILENFFGIAQPDVEIARKLDEQAMGNPIIQLMAIHEILVSEGSPYADIIMAQLQSSLQKAAGAQGQQPQGAAGMGLGLQQALGGNIPLIPGTGNPSEEEEGITPETALYGGPTEEMF